MSASFLNRRALLVGLAAGAVIVPRAFAADDAKPAYPLGLGRPHTDFIQTQVMPSHVLVPTGSQPGVDGATASYDAKGTRAVSVIFRYPLDWKMERKHYLNSDQEFYVLDGSVTFDGVTYKPGDYAYFPAGYEHSVMTAKNGAVLLNFYEGEHKAFYEAPPADMYKPKLLIKHVDTNAAKWTSGTKEDVAAWGKSAKRKLLRHDPATGESTWLLKVDADPKDVKRRVATHAAVEEMFLLDGTIATPQGVMTKGAYVWRVPGTAVGPFGTSTGFVALFRSKGGELKTAWSAQAQPVVWDAPFDPKIPDAFKSWVSNPFDRSKAF